jgi:hypothetical protein
MISPLRYGVSFDSATDVYGRPVSGSVVCASEMDAVPRSSMIFLVISDLVLCFAAIYWGVRCRSVETEYAESQYISFSLGTIFEGLFIGLPMAFFSRESPNTFYVVTAGIVVLVGLVAPLLIFIPKYASLKADTEGSDQFGGLASSMPSMAGSDPPREDANAQQSTDIGARIRHPYQDDIVYDAEGRVQSIRRPLRFANVRIPEAPSSSTTPR